MKVIPVVSDGKLAFSKRLEIETMECPTAPPCDLPIPSLEMSIEREL